ncbi:MAG: phosphotransferase [Cyanobacteria bacterium J06634_5]
MNFNHQLQVWLADTYGFTTLLALEFLQRPTAVQIVRITVSHRVYWLRLYAKSETSLEHIDTEASIVEQLFRQGISVACPIYRRDGKLVGSFRDYFGVTFTNAEGTNVEDPTVEQAAALGTLVASIHAGGSTLPLSNRPVIDYALLGERSLRAVEPYLSNRRTEFKELQHIAQRMCDRIWTDGKDTKLPSGFCHGDVHLKNVKFCGTSPTIFDFEACGTGPYVYDIACYWRKRLLANEDRAICEQEWAAFLKGYQAVRSLKQKELQAIPALATLRALWTMALPALPNITWGKDWLTEPSYFDAHFKMIQDFSRTC